MGPGQPYKCTWVAMYGYVPLKNFVLHSNQRAKPLLCLFFPFHGTEILWYKELHWLYFIITIFYLYLFFFVCWIFTCSSCPIHPQHTASVNNGTSVREFGQDKRKQLRSVYNDLFQPCIICRWQYMMPYHLPPIVLVDFLKTQEMEESTTIVTLEQGFLYSVLRHPLPNHMWCSFPISHHIKPCKRELWDSDLLVLIWSGIECGLAEGPRGPYQWPLR